MNNQSRFSIAVTLITVLQFHCTTTVYAAEKMPIESIDLNALTAETQKTIGSSGGVFNFVWVIPSEFWQASLTQDKAVSEIQRRSALDVLNKYMIVAVIRADISPFGVFSFHDEMTVFDGLHVAYVAGDGKRLPLKLQRRADDDAQIVIDAMKPILRAAMGNMGDNFHFFVCDKTAAGEGTRISAYESGTLAVTLDKAGKNIGGTGEIAFPLDSLYVPRQCSSCAKRAHISWNFCPWCGTKHGK